MKHLPPTVTREPPSLSGSKFQPPVEAVIRSDFMKPGKNKLGLGVEISNILYGLFVAPHNALDQQGGSVLDPEESFLEAHVRYLAAVVRCQSGCCCVAEVG